jgi:hypothetical protein
MPVESGGYEPEWEELDAQTQIETKKAEALAATQERVCQILTVAAKPAIAAQKAPGEVAHSISLGLEDAGWEYLLKFYQPVNPYEVPIPELEALRNHPYYKKTRRDPRDDFYIDLVTTDPTTNLTVAIPVRHHVPTRPSILAVNYTVTYAFHPLDLLLPVLIRLPEATRQNPAERRTISKPTYNESLATAVRDVTLPLGIYHALDPWRLRDYPLYPIIMDNALRDKVLAEIEREREEKRALKKQPRR